MGSLDEVRVLLTGSSGFIGSHLTRRLLQEGAEVYSLGRYSSTVKAPRLKDIWDKIVVLEADLRDFKPVRDNVRKAEPEIIYHLAAYTHVGRSFTHTDEAIQVNIQGTANLLHALGDVNFNCFVYTGTSEIYGTNPVPFKEDMKSHPVSPYSISKYAGEMFCRFCHEAHGYPVVMLRPFNAYGPYQSCNRIIPEVIVSCLLKKDLEMTEGKQTREFNYVEDLVEGFIKASLTQQAIGEIINLGNGMEYSIREIAEKITDLMGNPIKLKLGALPYRPTEIWRMYCDNIKAKKILGWKPQHSLEAGLEKTIDWYSKEYERNKTSIYT